jgi:hypothetical protein
MVRRRPAAAALAALTAALRIVPEVPVGAQTGDQALVRAPHFAPGLLKVAATVSLEAGKADTVAVFGQLTSVQAALLTDDVSRLGNGQSKLRLIQAIPGEEAVDLAAGGVATGAGGTSNSPSSGGRRFALLLLVGGGLAAAAGFVVQRRRSTG